MKNELKELIKSLNYKNLSENEILDTAKKDLQDELSTLDALKSEYEKKLILYENEKNKLNKDYLDSAFESYNSFLRLGEKRRNDLEILILELEKNKKIKDQKSLIIDYNFNNKVKKMEIEKLKSWLNTQLEKNITNLKNKNLSYNLVFLNLEHPETSNDFYQVYKINSDNDDLISLYEFKDIYFKELKKVKSYYKNLIEKPKPKKSSYFKPLLSLGIFTAIDKFANSKTRY